MLQYTSSSKESYIVNTKTKYSLSMEKDEDIDEIVWLLDPSEEHSTTFKKKSEIVQT